MDRSKLGIIADDLTGACDTAAQLAYYNMRTLVTKWYESNVNADANAFALNTQSRHIAPEEAGQRVRHAARTLSNLGATKLYKKIDSTLRGNWIVEIQDLMRSGDFDLALIAPAFPRTGRTTVNGCQYAHGRPLERTAFANDPYSPVVDSHILNLLRRQTSLPSELLPLTSVRKGTDEIINQVERLFGLETRLIVCDAENETDLERIASAGGQIGRRILWVGSAGLARHWPRITGDLELTHPPKVSLPKPMLLALGSLNPEGRKQAALLESAKRVCVAEINFDRVESQIEQVANKLASDHSILVATTDKQHPSALLVREQFADAVSEICHRARIATLVLIGGDTAERICDKLAVSGIRINGELDAGIPYGTIISGILDGVMLVTKAGGFGAEDALLGL